jgi:hypothetical protein
VNTLVRRTAVGVVFATSVAITLVVPPRSVAACSCVSTGADPFPVLSAQQAAAYGSTGVVFTGTAVAHRLVRPIATPNADGVVLIRSDDPVEWTFAVDHVIHGQGRVASLQPIQTPGDGAACGVSFEQGARYQVVAMHSTTVPGVLQVGLCSPTSRLTSPALPATASTARTQLSPPAFQTASTEATPGGNEEPSPPPATSWTVHAWGTLQGPASVGMLSLAVLLFVAFRRHAGHM